MGVGEGVGVRAVLSPFYVRMEYKNQFYDKEAYSSKTVVDALTISRNYINKLCEDSRS